MQTFIFLALALGWVLISFEISDRLVRGKLLSEKALDEFLSKNLDKYILNSQDEECNLFWNPEDPWAYIARKPIGSLFSRWSVAGMGRVPRWSRWYRLLESNRITLISDRDNT